MFEHSLYLLSLLLSLLSLSLIDRRYRLVLWRRPSVGAPVLVLSLVFFLSWDAAGIALSIFFSGDSPYMLGVYLAPEFPPEELLFLSLLTYLPLLITTWLERRHA